MGGNVNVDSDAVRRAANGKLADAADGTATIAGRLRGLGAGEGLGGAGEGFATRERATQEIFGGAIEQAHVELSGQRDGVNRGMDAWDRTDGDSAAKSEALGSALGGHGTGDAPGRSGIKDAFDEGREQAGGALADTIGEEEVELTQQEQQLAEQANVENGTDAPNAAAGQGETEGDVDGGQLTR